MAADEQNERRFQGLERKLDEVMSLIRDGSPRSEERAEDILSRLPADDRALLERHRFRTQYGPVLDEWLEEKMQAIESEAGELDDGDGDPDGDDGDGDDVDGDAVTATRTPARTPAKRAKPQGGRHRSESDDRADKPDRVAQEPWWRRD